MDTILCDLHACEDGEPLMLRASCRSPRPHEVQLKFGGTKDYPKVVINITLIDGALYIDVIDVVQLEKDDIFCGAEASFSAKLRVGHDKLKDEEKDELS